MKIYLRKSNKIQSKINDVKKFHQNCNKFNLYKFPSKTNKKNPSKQIQLTLTFDDSKKKKTNEERKKKDKAPQ